ncbi:MAG: hypothetical protein AMXMBFR34_47520 [Myxococcaceae bacterium]
MSRRALASLSTLLAFQAGAVPPVPRLVQPTNGEWTSPAKTFSLGQQGSATLTGAFTHFEIEVFTDAGVAATTWCSNSVGAFSRSCAAPTLDAGDYSWRARTLDGGERSAWTNPESFRWDDEVPTTPSGFTIAWVDGGAVGLTWDAGSDGISGVLEYHWGASYLPLDAGINFGSLFNLTPNTSRTAWLGPGDWMFGVHTHDVAGNSSYPGAEVGPVRVLADPTIPAPTPPFFVQGDGGRFILEDSSPTFTWTSPLDGGRFVVAQRTLESDGGVGVLGLVLSTPQRLATVDQDEEGLFQLLVAHAWDSGVSDWSSPTTFVVDGRNPARPALAATTDGGEVYLSWPEVNDTGFWRSGVAGYTLDRCCTADASVRLGTFPAASPDASVATVDGPGPGTWRYEVRARDLVGNASLPGVALVAVQVPPSLAAPVVTPSPLATGPVTVSWEDGGAGLLFDLQRAEEGLPSGPVVAADTPASSFVDAPPDGRWQYAVRAKLGPQVGPWSPFSAPVLVDSTPPQVTLSARRQTATEVLLEWTAQDTGSGLSQVTLERETAGLVISLGAVTQSPVVETPPDGTHRYRAVATDVAGHVTSIAWSADVVTPGPVVSIAPVPGQVATCGARFSLLLSASGDGPVTWALVSGAAGAAVDVSTGELSWTPGKADVGPHLLRVRATAPASLDEKDVPVEVTCEPRKLGLGCGCTSAVEWPLLLAALAWAVRRRRARHQS